MPFHVDRFVPLLADIAPDAQVQVSEACGHVMPMEHPDIVAGVIHSYGIRRATV